jgi:hypothetical protein
MIVDVEAFLSARLRLASGALAETGPVAALCPTNTIKGDDFRAAERILAGRGLVDLCIRAPPVSEI